MDSHEALPALGIALHGHASPSDTPLTEVRDGGQMLASPVIRTFHNTGSGTISMEEA